MAYLTIIAKFKLHDNVEYVKKELLRLVKPTRQEKGCIDYTFYLDNENTSLMMLYENWESEKDLDAHMKAVHFVDCFRKIEGMYELEVHRLTEIT